ncbi:MAG: polysaccharide biosynthesis tyrosine autokinase [Bacteroidales bacterium]|nr:polysaccharide biosynthesis tyrosine autokinase [Bacteroidales bacterium]
MTEKNNSQINLVDLFFYLLGKWYWFVLCIIVFVGLAYYRYAKTPLVFRSDATVIIKDPSNTRATVHMDNYSSLINHVSMSNEILQLQSKQLMAEALRSLGANVNYTVQERLRNIELYDHTPVQMTYCDEGGNGYLLFDLTPCTDSLVSIDTRDGLVREFRLGDTLTIHGTRIVLEPTKYYRRFRDNKITLAKFPPYAAARHFLARLKVTQTESDGTILQLSLQDNNLQRASDVLNALIAKYNEDAIRDKNRIAVNTAAFIDERLSIIQQELGTVESDLASFKSSERIMDVNESANEYLEESKGYGAEIVKIETRARLASYLKDYLRKAFNSYEPVPVNTGLDDPNIEASIAGYNDMILQRDRLVRGSSAQSPAVKQVEANIAPVRQNIVSAIDNLLSSLNTRKAELSRLEKASIKKFTSMPAKARELVAIERQQKIKEALYVFLLNKREENALTQAMVDNNARMIDSAEGPASPIYPQRNKMLLLGLLMGIFLPALLLISRIFIDTKIRGRRDLDSIANLPFLADIPSIKSGRKIVHRKQKKSPEGPKVEYTFESSKVFREAMRMMCANIDYMKPEGCTSPVLMTTSFNVGVGKSFITRNIAACLADACKKVIIVDADLRKRSISDWFGRKHHMQGLSNYLVNKEIGVDDVICQDLLPGVDFVPAGHIPPNPTELLSRHRFEELIEELRKRYDYIIMDGTPVNMVADSFVMGRLVDMNLFVLRSGLSDRRQIPMVDNLLKEGRLKHLSIILNGTDAKHSYGYSYGYGYGYGYGYYGSGYYGSGYEGK